MKMQINVDVLEMGEKYTKKQVICYKNCNVYIKIVKKKAIDL